ncbi:hypothetical protein LY76DRAFT_411038 [Colletotrichum caudatum]|nr:hypothetical protein LY76DRAFT_411038 [Colletotrichum caudatum]
MTVNVDCAGKRKRKKSPALSAAQRVLSRRHGRSENATEPKAGRHARPPGVPHSLTHSPQLRRPAARNTLAPRTWRNLTPRELPTDDRVANPSCPYCDPPPPFFAARLRNLDRDAGAKACVLGTRAYIAQVYGEGPVEPAEEAPGGCRKRGPGWRKKVRCEGGTGYSPCIVHSFTRLGLVHTGT